MYKGSSTSFSYVEKVEDQVLEPCTAESGGEPCMADSGGAGSQRRATEEEEADIGAAVEETGVESGGQETDEDFSILG
jgi:hypothetical protein